MSMHITSRAATRFDFNAAGGATAAERLDKSQARRESFQQLSQALASGNLNASRSAYASLVKNAPAAASWRPDSPFAQLGKALVNGDLSAAQTSFDAMAINRMKEGGAAQPPITTQPTDPASSSVGAPGGSIDLMA